MSDSDKGAAKKSKPASTAKPSGTKSSGAKPSSGAADKAEAASRRRRTPQKAKPQKVKSDELNPVWWVPTMCALMVVGLIWLVVCYLTQTDYPIPGITNWNLVIGFVAIMAGFLMTTRWR